MTVVQVELQAGATHRVCWVDQRKRFAVGDGVTLKNAEDESRIWTVLSISDHARDAAGLRTDWRVGGITEWSH